MTLSAAIGDLSADQAFWERTSCSDAPEALAVLRKRGKVLQNPWSAQVVDCAMEAVENALALKAN